MIPSSISSLKPVYPDLGESQLNLPDLLDFHLKHNPDYPLYAYTNPEGSGSGSVRIMTEIKALEYVRAVHRVANFIWQDGHSRPGDVIGLVVNIDSLLYSVLIVGIIKAGMVPFPMSPRNSSAALLHLIRKTSMHRVITSTLTQSGLRGVIDDLKAQLKAEDASYELTIGKIPPFGMVFPVLGRERAEDPFVPFDSTLVFPPPKDEDKALYLHSSGSTGLPKPILLTHRIIKDDAAALYITRFREFFSPHPVFGAFALPTFHIMGFCCQILMPLYGIVTTVIFAPTMGLAECKGSTGTQATFVPNSGPIVVTPESVLEAARIIKLQAMVVVPALIHAWAIDEEAVEFLKTMQYLGFGGGPLAPQIAESLLARGVPVQTGYGATEFGIVMELRVPHDPKTWNYLEFRKTVKIRWVDQGNGNFEPHFLSSDSHHVAVENLPDVAGYATSDLCVPHPTIPDLWKIVGRIDDVIAHSSGEKTVPGPIEAIITASPMLGGAIMFGRQHDQPGILLEPLLKYQIDVTNEKELSKFRSMIWPLIEDANKIAPAFSRIFREMILIVDPNKPLPRVGKGTVARKAALALYQTEIDQLYKTIEENSGGNSINPPQSWAVEDLEIWLSDQILTGILTKVPAADEDLFEHGFDSLSSTILRLRLVATLRKAGFSSAAAAIHQNIVYSHHSIALLAHAIADLVADPAKDSKDGRDRGDEKTHVDAIEAMISKYSQGLHDSIPHTVQESVNGQPQCILLTGSTGNLGAQLLQLLLLDDSVARVYTLNRSSTQISMLDRHQLRFQDKGLDSSLLASPKLVFLTGETFREDLGLPECILKELRQNLTMIIHNAWRLDFNLSLASFESHVKGSRNLIDLARSSRCASSLRFLFTSSIASAQSWDARSQGPYPERVILDAKYAVGAGYGESKYVTERILARSGVQATSFRIDQVAGGAPNGAWATSDWVPILVQSSLKMNKLPDAAGLVSWVPMDAVCQAVLDVGMSAEAPKVVNVTHPKPVSWNWVIRSIRDTLIQEKKLCSDALPLVSYGDWVANIEKRTASEGDTGNIPAIKLLDFFRLLAKADDALMKAGSKGTTESMGFTPLSTENVQKLSERMRTIQRLDADLIRKWISYWIHAGFL